MDGVIYVSDSANIKISGTKKVDSTYTTIEGSCPKDCPLKGEGCYGSLSYVGIVSSRLDKEANGLTALQIARAEAKAIDNSYSGKSVPTGRDLRLHVAGDSRTKAGSALINSAIGRWKRRGGGKCWSYTHAWRHVPRNIWSNVSMLASVSDVAEAEEARKQGYAPAIVVSEFESNKTFTMGGSNIKWIPCPAQTKDTSCVDCKLCFDANRLFNGNFGIAFEAHGVKKNDIKRRLTVLK